MAGPIIECWSMEAADSARKGSPRTTTPMRAGKPNSTREPRIVWISCSLTEPVRSRENSERCNAGAEADSLGMGGELSPMLLEAPQPKATIAMTEVSNKVGIRFMALERGAKRIPYSGGSKIDNYA